MVIGGYKYRIIEGSKGYLNLTFIFLKVSNFPNLP